MAVRFGGLVNSNLNYDYSGVEEAVEAPSFSAQRHHRRRANLMVSLRWWAPAWNWLMSWVS